MSIAFTILSAACGLVMQPVDIPPYAEAPDIEHYASEAVYAEASADERFVMRRFAYQSDGLEVFAYVYGPDEAPRARPTVIFNRGSYVRGEFAAEILPMAHRLAEAGFMVVAPMYRGSGGAAGRDEMGGDELADLFNLPLAMIPGVDPDRLYLYGESRGGMMVYQALRDGFPARAAAVYGSFTDLGALVEDPQWAGMAEALWPDFAEERNAIIERRSALQWADRIAVPVLIMHGADDGAIPLRQSLQLAEQLAELDRPFELWVAEDGDHVLSNHTEERDTRATAWFASHGEPVLDGD